MAHGFPRQCLSPLAPLTAQLTIAKSLLNKGWSATISRSPPASGVVRARTSASAHSRTSVSVYICVARLSSGAPGFTNGRTNAGVGCQNLNLGRSCLQYIGTSDRLTERPAGNVAGTLVLREGAQNEAREDGDGVELRLVLGHPRPERPLGVYFARCCQHCSNHGIEATNHSTGTCLVWPPRP